jgi:hypothetical protein
MLICLLTILYGYIHDTVAELSDRDRLYVYSIQSPNVFYLAHTEKKDGNLCSWGFNLQYLSIGFITKANVWFCLYTWPECKRISSSSQSRLINAV